MITPIAGNKLYLSFGKNTPEDFESPSKLPTNAVYEKWINPKKPKDTEIDRVVTLFQMSDNHLKYKPLLSISTAIKELNQKLNKAKIDFLKIHSGDYGNGKGNSDKLKLQIKLLNLFGINSAAAGNHEFDIGSENFAKALKEAKFPTLTTNLRINKDKSPELYNLTQGENPKIKNSQIIQDYGLTGISPIDLKETGIINLEEQAYIVPEPGADLQSRTNATVDTVKNEVKKLESTKINGKNIDKIIMESHGDIDVDEKIARETDGIDIIAGGHGHRFTSKVVFSPSGKPVVITQQGQNGKNFRVTDLAFDKNGEILSFITRVENSGDFAPDKDASKIVNNVLGSSPVIGKSDADCPLDKVKTEEHPFANFVADSMKSHCGADIALLAGFSIRDDVNKGEITSRDIEDTLSLSFDYPIIKRKLTGKQIIEALERGAWTFSKNNERQGRPGILQVSGLKYTIEKDGKVVDVKIMNKDGSFSPIIPENPYNVAYEAKLKNGIENFTSLMEPDKPDDVIYELLPEIVVKAIKDRNGEPLNLKKDGRITVKA